VAGAPHYDADELRDLGAQSHAAQARIAEYYGAFRAPII